MKTKIIVTILMLTGTLFAMDSVKSELKNAGTKYQKVLNIFKKADEMKINMQMDRTYLSKQLQNNPEQIFTVLYTKDNYLKITISDLKEDSVASQKNFYFTPDGKLAIAETTNLEKTRKTFLYDEDNPTLFMQSGKNEKMSQQMKSFFEELPHNEENTALALLKDSVGYYNATKEFIDNLPES